MKKSKMKEQRILKRLYTDELIILPALDGSKTIANSGDIFKSYLDPDFKIRKINKKDQSTKETQVQVHEMVQDANFKKMFGSLNDDLNKLCLTQNQIVKFCEKYPHYLRKGGEETFFLFKETLEYFVAYVLIDPYGLNIYWINFDYRGPWDAKRSHRLVVPQIEI